MRKYLVLLCMITVLQVYAVESPTVPSNIEFAGLNLKLSENARKKIQAEVDALTRYSKYYQIKAERLQMYLPIIERVFREEGLPDDFKYLVLQESGLVSDAVSSSNAVGFWQFKQATAVEVGLRVDRSVDERLNIVASTRGAATYIKKNNRLYFDNWVHSLLAYQQGPGGAQKLVKQKYQGSRSMPIDGHTHWYVIKFLAHKIAFEQVQSNQPSLHLVEYYEGQGKSLKEIAHQHQLDHALVEKYNKWLKHGKVPGDKSYAVILPYDQQPAMLASEGQRSNQVPTGANSRLESGQYPTHPAKYPVIKTFRNPSKGIKINGIRGIRLMEDMDLEDLEQTTGVPVRRLLHYNDVKSGKKPKAGELWYLRSKRGKAQESYHIAENGEDLWTISQKYGIRMSQLRRKNRIDRKQTAVKHGRVLWLQSVRPADVPVAYVTDKPTAVAEPVSSNADVLQPKVKTTATGVAAPPQRKPQSSNISNTGQPSKSTNSGQMLHEVLPGETLYSISRQYGVTIDELRAWNNLAETAVLGVGQQIRVRPGEPVPDGQTTGSTVVAPEFETYQVKAGDTLYQIAREHQTTIKDLMEWNGKSDFNLSTGEELKVRKLP